MKDEQTSRIVSRIKDIYERVEIYQGNYAELDTKENGILRAVSRLERPRVGDVARELNISMSTASWCIDRLEKKKYLARRRTEEDRRAVYVSLTAKGKKIVSQFDEMFERLGRAARERLSPGELKAFAGMLERIGIDDGVL